MGRCVYGYVSGWPDSACVKYMYSVGQKTAFPTSEPITSSKTNNVNKMYNTTRWSKIISMIYV